ncbi:hypothetical protein C2S51_012983 [Perilla frutescens var. frutescens]|nr:hypothetical protein C2S51_012983 [Perilla frutescens var. frutescens]
MLAWRVQLHGRSRFGLLSIYPQFRRNINYYLPKFSLKSHGRHSLEVSASISAKPSSKLRKKPQNPEPNDKLAALRELLSGPMSTFRPGRLQRRHFSGGRGWEWGCGCCCRLLGRIKTTSFCIKRRHFDSSLTAVSKGCDGGA